MDEQSTPVSDSAAVLGNLLSNPALLQSIGSILGSSSANTAGTPSPPSADGLTKALSDPTLMAKLPQVIAMLQPMLANASAESANKDDTTATAATADAVPTIAPPPPRRPQVDCRDDLLLALKPFLSPARCEAVDTIIRLSKLGAVLKHLQ